MNVIDSSNKIYFKYLLKRSLLGRLYREFILYPKLNKLLYNSPFWLGPVFYHYTLFFIFDG